MLAAKGLRPAQTKLENGLSPRAESSISDTAALQQYRGAQPATQRIVALALFAMLFLLQRRADALCKAAAWAGLLACALRFPARRALDLEKRGGFPFVHAFRPLAADALASDARYFQDHHPPPGPIGPRAHFASPRRRAPRPELLPRTNSPTFEVRLDSIGPIRLVWLARLVCEVQLVRLVRVVRVIRFVQVFWIIR